MGATFRPCLSDSLDLDVSISRNCAHKVLVGPNQQIALPALTISAMKWLERRFCLWDGKDMSRRCLHDWLLDQFHLLCRWRRQRLSSMSFKYKHDHLV